MALFIIEEKVIHSYTIEAKNKKEAQEKYDSLLEQSDILEENTNIIGICIRRGA